MAGSHHSSGHHSGSHHSSHSSHSSHHSSYHGSSHHSSYHGSSHHSSYHGSYHGSNFGSSSSYRSGSNGFSELLDGLFYDMDSISTESTGEDYVSRYGGGRQEPEYERPSYTGSGMEYSSYSSLITHASRQKNLRGETVKVSSPTAFDNDMEAAPATAQIHEKSWVLGSAYCIDTDDVYFIENYPDKKKLILQQI